MSVTPNDSLVAPDVIDAACELICKKGHGHIVHIGQLLEELSEKFGGRFRVSPNVYDVVNLIELLWEDPHIDEPQRGWIEFAWNEKGADPERTSRLMAMLLGRSDAGATKELVMASSEDDAKYFYGSSEDYKKYFLALDPGASRRRVQVSRTAEIE